LKIKNKISDFFIKKQLDLCCEKTLYIFNSFFSNPFLYDKGQMVKILILYNNINILSYSKVKNKMSKIVKTKYKKIVMVILLSAPEIVWFCLKNVVSIKWNKRTGSDPYYG